MALIPGTLPSDTCYGTPQDLLELFAQYLSIPAADFQSDVVFSTSSTGLLSTQLWFDTTTASNPIMNIYVSGSWVDYLKNYIDNLTVATTPLGASDYIPVLQGGVVKKIAATNIVLVGSIIAWPTNTVPTGYLECDGSAVSRTTYATLFATIGVTYGAGDTVTTFNLPDYRGRFLRSWAHGQSTDPDRGSRTDRGDGTTGDNVGTKQADEYKSHSHAGLRINFGVGPRDVPGGANVSDTTGAAGGNETRPINTTVMYCIKF